MTGAAEQPCSICLDPLALLPIDYVERHSAPRGRFRLAAGAAWPRAVLSASQISRFQHRAVTLCGHEFHTACLQATAHIRGRCPLCRSALKPDSDPVLLQWGLNFLHGLLVGSTMIALWFFLPHVSRGLVNIAAFMQSVGASRVPSC